MTGSDLSTGATIAIVLIAVGGLIYLFRRNLPGGRRH